MLKLSVGSVLSKKCDLIVLPCNSNGGYTSWVDFEIKFNGLPKPRGRIPFGSLQFRETHAKYPIADYVGFAASVDSETGKSTLAAISSILRKAIQYAEATGSTLVNLPLLGTGAGGLSRASVLKAYSGRLAKSKILFEIFVPDDPSLTLPESSAARSSAAGERKPLPRVFISYARTNPEVGIWVRKLHDVLQRARVDVRLDQLLLRPGMDLAQWMTNEVVKAAKVLLICDANYAAKADARSAGVGWETMIIQGDLLSQGTTSTKYIPIAFDGDPAQIPVYLRTKLWLSRQEVESNLERLVRSLFDENGDAPGGRLPSWPAQRPRR